MHSCLVVDDSTTIRKAIIRILQKFPFTFLEAEDGQKALDICKKELPFLIILDWNMPIMTGIEFLKLLRQLPQGTTPKVIFCTTENELPFIQEALVSGADEYIMKPFTEPIIEEKLHLLGIL